ncbi:MAG: hypothetical protein VYA80_07300 [Pseudomonadota bacterium]|nr:hypothetical protein [Pseudomonadota bacterium]
MTKILNDAFKFSTLVVAFSFLMPFSTSLAASWDWGSEVRLTGRSNDNPTLRSETFLNGDPFDIQSAESLNASVEFDLIRATENTRLTLTPRVSQNYYPDDAFKDLENTNLYLSGNSQWIQDRTNWSLGFRIEDVGLLSSEDISDIATGGSLFRADDTRSRFTINPGFSWAISELDQFSLGASLSKIDYSLDFTNRADQDLSSVSIAYQRIISPKQTLGFFALASSNESDRLLRETDPLLFENETDGISFNLDYSLEINSDLRLSARVGRQESDTKSSGVIVAKDDPADVNNNLGGNCSSIVDIGNVPDPNDLFNPFDVFQYNDCERTIQSTILEFDLKKNFQKSDLTLSLLRSVVPNSTGTPQERNQFKVKFERKITDFLRFDTSLIAYEQESINFQNVQTKNEGIKGEIGIDWVISKNWAIGGQYIYRKRENGRSFDLDLPEGAEDPNITEPLDTRDSNEFGFYVRYFIEKPEL